MFKFIKRILQITLLFILVALILNLKYNKKSAREYASEYGKKIFNSIYQFGKGLVGKDLKEIGSDLLPTVKKTFKEFDEKNTPSSQDQLTDQDRKKLEKLLKEKGGKK